MRGKKVEIDEYIANIEEYLKEGCSLHEACLHGLTPYRTVKDYYDNDEDIRKKIDRLQNTPILQARRSVNQHMLEDGKLAMDYLKNKKSDEFSTKSESENRSTMTIMGTVKIGDKDLNFNVGD